MKRINSILIITLFVMVGSIGCKQSGTQSDDLVTVDVTASYPKKELVLQDCFDIEYVPLETNDVFVTHGYVRAIGKDVIVIRNYINDGNIFIFDRKDGKALKMINHKGNGAVEYINAVDILLDDDAGEILVNDGMGGKMLLYDLNGTFIRSFNYENMNRAYRGVNIFDQDNLICFDRQAVFDREEVSKQSFEIISKQDGRVTKEIEFNFDEKKSMFLVVPEVGSAFIDAYPPIIPYLDHFLLTELSTDTVYRYTRDHQMIPFMTRTPSIQTMVDPEVYVFPTIITDRYYFMIKVDKVWDFVLNEGFPVTNLMYDIDKKAIFECHAYNSDFTDKRPIELRYKFAHEDVAFWQILEAHELVEAYEEGKLKGKLKELVATLDEESNPVIMLAKHKKQ